MKQIVYFGIMYALIFTGFYVTNGFLTIIYPNEAFIGFAIFYGLYGIASLLSPYLYMKLNLIAALILSSFTFLIYVGFASSKLSYMMLVGSGIAGVGNAVIWLIQGIWMSEFPDSENKSLWIGIFFGIFNVNIIVGNLISIIILIASESSISIMMWAMIGVTGIGFSMTFFVSFIIRNTNSQNTINQNINVKEKTTEQEKEEKSFLQVLKKVFTVISINKGYLLIPFFLAQAISLNITYQIITRLLIINSRNIHEDPNIYNAAMYLAYGVSAIIFSIVWGKIYDKFGYKLVLGFYLSLELTCLIGILMLNKFSSNGPLGYWIIIGFVRGMIDNAINSIINITIARYYPKDGSYFFALYRFIYAVSYATFSVCIAYIQYEYILLIDCVIAIISTICYIYFSIYYSKLITNNNIELTEVKTDQSI